MRRWLRRSWRRLEEQGLVEQAASNPGAVERAAADYLRSQGYLRARVTAGAPLFEDARRDCSAER